MHDLSVALASAGHTITYLTMRHWPSDEQPASPPGVRVVDLAPAGRIYETDRRSMGRHVRFGLAVGRHLARNGADYDIVHTASFPYFPLLAARATRRRGNFKLVVDWHEVWGRHYWRRYAGPIVGTAGWLVQRACARIDQQPFCMSRMHATRLEAEGVSTRPIVLPGLYAGPTGTTHRASTEPLVVYAGRHVAEKRVPALVRAFAVAHSAIPELRLKVFGEGPEHGLVLDLVRELGLSGVAQVVGRRAQSEVEDAIARAAAVVTASEREGYGLVVVEAAARGTPSVIVDGPENAATELVEHGVNGIVARSAAPSELGACIVEAVRRGDELRSSTTRWFSDNVDRLLLDRSIAVVLDAYSSLVADSTR